MGEQSLGQHRATTEKARPVGGLHQWTNVADYGGLARTEQVVQSTHLWRQRKLSAAQPCGCRIKRQQGLPPAAEALRLAGIGL